MKFKTLALLLGIAMITWLGCSKEDFNEGVATIVDSGPIADGGCGIVIRLDTTTLTMADSTYMPEYYEPVNLPNAYQVDGQQVTITYKIVEDNPDCTWLNGMRGQMYVHKIEGIQ